MQILKNVNLAECTAFETGGRAEVFVNVTSAEELIAVLQTQPRPLWLLGQGANSLISDKGLPGTTIHLELKDIRFEGNDVIAGSGCDWDTLVRATLEHDLWGMELMSGIPGTVGAAVVGNIAAYGQAVADTLKWVDVVDFAADEPVVERLDAARLGLDYRSSKLANDSNTIIILQACFGLSERPITDLQYESALSVARELNLEPDSLQHRRQIIMTARERAGSLLDTSHRQKTAGSFFKNPMVTPEQAEQVMSFEEHAIPMSAIQKQNMIHGGSAQRVSAAHVVLAAGFQRGQTWGAVRIHPDHALKLENTGGATSQQIYDVAQEIMQAAKDKLGIELQPEVRFIGDFS